MFLLDLLGLSVRKEFGYCLQQLLGNKRRQKLNDLYILAQCSKEGKNAPVDVIWSILLGRL